MLQRSVLRTKDVLRHGGQQVYSASAHSPTSTLRWPVLIQPLPCLQRHASTNRRNKYGRALQAAESQGGRNQRRFRDVNSTLLIQNCKQLGFSRRQTHTLLVLVTNRVRYSQPPDHTYTWLMNLESYLKNPDSISKQLRRRYEFLEKEDMMREFQEFPRGWREIGTHDPENIGKALTFMGYDRVFLMSRLQVAESEQMGLLQHAAYFFEVATLFKNVDAARCVLHLDSIVQEEITNNTAPAINLLKKNVFEDEKADWTTIVTYMNDEYRPTKMARHSPAEFAKALQLLQNAAAQTSPGKESEGRYLLECYITPWELMQRLIDHCLQARMQVPGFSNSDLWTLRRKCLVESLVYNDASACFEIGVREEVFGSPAWERLITCAASSANPDACWLLAIHFWQKDGLLEITKTKQPMKQLAAYNEGFEWARLAIFCQSKQPVVLQNRAHSTAALLRVHGLHKDGESFLSDVIFHTERLSWFPQIVQKKLGDLLKRYYHPPGSQEEKAADLWTEQRCHEDIRQKLNKEWAMGLAEKQLLKVPTGIATRP